MSEKIAVATPQTQANQEGSPSLGDVVRAAANNRGSVEPDLKHRFAHYEMPVLGPEDRTGHQKVIGEKDVVGAMTVVSHPSEQSSSTTTAKVRYEDQRHVGLLDSKDVKDYRESILHVTKTPSRKNINTKIDIVQGQDFGKDNRAIETRTVNNETKYKREMSPRRIAAAKRLATIRFGIEK